MTWGNVGRGWRDSNPRPLRPERATHPGRPRRPRADPVQAQPRCGLHPGAILRAVACERVCVPDRCPASAAWPASTATGPADLVPGFGGCRRPTQAPCENQSNLKYCQPPLAAVLTASPLNVARKRYGDPRTGFTDRYAVAALELFSAKQPEVAIVCQAPE